MQDLRAAPRWSKTAGIVVLVVFGLVLIVAVFGLWALTTQFDEQQRERLEQARADGNALLDDVVDGEGDGDRKGINRTLQGVLNRAFSLDRGLSGVSWRTRDGASRELRHYLEGQAHGSLATWVVRVDGGEGRVLRWIGGRHRLFVPLNLLRAEAEADRAAAADQDAIAERARAARRTHGAMGALGEWEGLARDYGLTVRRIGGGAGRKHADGLGWTHVMIESAADVVGEDAEAGAFDRRLSLARIRDLLLLVEDVLHANRRLGAKDVWDYDVDLYTRDIRDVSARLLRHLPEGPRADLAWELTLFRDLQAALADDDFRAGVEAVHLQASSKEHRARVFSQSEGSMFGSRVLSGSRTLVVLLERGAVRRLVDERLAARRSALRQLGQTAKVFPSVEDKPLLRLDPSDEVAEALMPVGLRELHEPIDLPWNLAIFQTGQPVGAEDKWASFLFWAVILLAGAGLCVGGYVLVRLVTREMRLAQLKADFVSNLSHELKTPITSISLFTEMLEDGKLTDPEDQGEAFSVIGQEIRRLQRIVNRMIDVARGEARTTPYSLAPGDLNRTVLGASTRFRRIVTEPGLDLDVQLHPGPLGVQMDVQALDDVVTNLLSNAWKYKREDKAQIVVRTARRGRHAEIVVQDDGVGIPRHERRKVFDMFYRADQYLTHPVAGTGLGLALVRSVVAGHKGRIDVDAAPGGVGSVFTVRIPLDRAAEAALAAGEVLPGSDIVDDDPASDAPDAPPYGKVLPS